MQGDELCQDFGFAPRSAAFRSNPYPAYQALRSQAPIYQRVKGDWLLTRYSDVAQVLKSTDFGRAEPVQIATSFASPLLQRRAESQRLMQLWFVLQNPPTHSRLRGILHQLYTRQSIQSFRKPIQRKVDQLLRGLQNRQRIDLVTDVADPLALYVNCALLMEIPEADWHPSFAQWSYSLSVIADLDVMPIAVEQGLLAIAGLADYFRRWITLHADRLGAQQGMLGVLYIAYQSGELTEEEMIATCIFLFTVGHSSTANLIGVAVLTLLQHPDQLMLLRKEIDLTPCAVAEVLRYDCVVQGVARMALVDTTLSGQTIQQGQIVNCLIGAANRDPAKFPVPDKFDIVRSTTGHLALGLGIHTCLGRHLGVLVAELAIHQLLIYFPVMTLQSDDWAWEDSFLGHGLKSLPVMLR